MPIVASIFALLVVAQTVFGKNWLPGDLKQIQNDMLQHAKALDIAIKACTTLPANIAAAWNEFLGRLTRFATTDFGWVTTVTPDGSTHVGGGDGRTADDAQALTKELYEWGQKVEALNCTLVAPNTKPPEDKKTLDPTVMTAIKYAAVVAGFVGSAYVVGQIASTVRLFKAPAKG